MITLPDGSRESIGSFKTERDAAIAYDVFARRYHGQFARLNFPDEIHTQLPLSAVSNASTLRRGRRFKGVYRRRHRFTALLVVPPKKRIYLGTFSSEEEAARAYDTAAKLHLRANCFLNFPNESQSKE